MSTCSGMSHTNVSLLFSWYSVGDWTGETYVSDLTCAFLEDTGYYTCDYSKLGSLTVGTTLEAALAENIFSTETRDAILKAFEDPFNSEEARLFNV